MTGIIQVQLVHAYHVFSIGMGDSIRHVNSWCFCNSYNIMCKTKFIWNQYTPRQPCTRIQHKYFIYSSYFYYHTSSSKKCPSWWTSSMWILVWPTRNSNRLFFTQPRNKNNLNKNNCLLVWYCNNCQWHNYYFRRWILNIRHL